MDESIDPAGGKWVTAESDTEQKITGKKSSAEQEKVAADCRTTGSVNTCNRNY